MSAKSQDVANSRALLRSARSATLSTALANDGGWAYGSLITVATDLDGSPLMLFSGLSDHTRNIAKDPRASLLIERASRRRNPQTGPRVSVLGRIAMTSEKRHTRRFLAHHPDAERYAGFSDFNFYHMRVKRFHIVGGFARARWLKAKDVLADACAAAALAKAEPDIIEHMNADHGEAVDLYANALLKRCGCGWRITGVDPDGADLVLDGRFARLDFLSPCSDAGQCRDQLIHLAALARVSAEKKNKRLRLVTSAFKVTFKAKRRTESSH
ncbi:MAG: DUF2470 domain-containing protein [Pseudomonadota bacterium]|nr:DUF2470 domain-containing protein [Pseudomonadota bacterium]